MTAIVSPTPQKMSRSAVTGMILGLAGCVPLVASLFALIFSIKGMKATKNNKMKGRGFAIAGLTLGLLGLGVWACVGIMAMKVLTESAEPRQLTRNFAREVTAGNYGLAKTMCHEYLGQQLNELNREMNSNGTYVDLTSYWIDIRDNSSSKFCRLKGVAEFKGTSRDFEATLFQLSEGIWEINDFRLK